VVVVKLELAKGAPTTITGRAPDWRRQLPPKSREHAHLVSLANAAGAHEHFFAFFVRVVLSPFIRGRNWRTAVGAAWHVL